MHCLPDASQPKLDALFDEMVIFLFILLLTITVIGCINLQLPTMAFSAASYILVAFLMSSCEGNIRDFAGVQVFGV